MKTDGNDSASGFDGPYSGAHGLTKRELFAAMAMQGIISSPQFAVAEIATDAVRLADELIEALNKDL